MAVGAWTDNDGEGLVYVFVREGDAWTQRSILAASNPGEDDWFGWSVGAHHGTIVVGAINEQSLSGGVDGDQSNNGATSVDVHGDFVVVGSRGDDSSATGVGGDETLGNEPNSGAAYVFHSTSAGWVQDAFVKASNADSGDWFGAAVAIHGASLVVGAPLEGNSSTGSTGNPSATTSEFGYGACYVFDRVGSTWAQSGYLKVFENSGRGRLGFKVDIFERTVALAAHRYAFDVGAVFVYERDGDQWAEQGFLQPSNPGIDDFFGESVALSGNITVVGSIWEDGSGSLVNPPDDNLWHNSGAVYAYARCGGEWTQGGYLKLPIPEQNDNLGVAVAASGPTIAGGAPGAPDGVVAIFNVPGTASAQTRSAPGTASSYASNLPVLGETWTATVDLSSTGHALAWLAAADALGKSSLLGGQTLLLSGTPQNLGFPPQPGPLATFSMAIPSDPSLCGFACYTQAVHLGGVQPFALSNAIDLIVGEH